MTYCSRTMATETINRDHYTSNLLSKCMIIRAVFLLHSSGCYTFFDMLISQRSG